MRLDKRLKAFDERRNALLDEMEALEPGKLLARPRAGKWSILEIVEHLVLAERVVFQGLPEPSQLKVREPRLKHRIRYLIVMFVLRTGIPVGVVSPAMNPRGSRDLAELRRLWDENKAWLLAYIDYLGPQGIKQAALRHPVAGPISLRQGVVMSRVHLERHIRQIRTLQKLLA
jgi:DinB superfamily